MKSEGTCFRRACHLSVKGNRIWPSKSASLLTCRPCSAIIAGLALAAVLVCVLYWYYEGEWRGLFFRFKYFYSFKRLRDFILSFGAYSAVVFVLLQALQVVFAPIPGEITGFVGGYLYGKFAGTTLSTIGLVAGSVFAFEITRFFGVRLVSKMVTQEVMGRFDEFVTHRGLRIAFLLFLIPGFPKDSLCYLLGLTHVSRLDFILMNIFGRLPGTLILVMEGDAVRTGRYHAFFQIFAGSVALTLILYVFRFSVIRSLSRMVEKVSKTRRRGRGKGGA